MAPESPDEVKRMAAELAAETRAAPRHNTPTERAICHKYAHRLKGASPEFVLDLARELLEGYDMRWQAYELLAGHRAALKKVGAAELEILGHGINSWWAVDSFARTLSGPAWRKGQVSDDLILSWAHTDDLWWRRAALVSTVAWNVRSRGGRGDIPRTLMVCRLLVSDHEDMVVKALSWALRELVVHDPAVVEGFLQEYDHVLARRVVREVRNKLRTGLKNPK
jgi:3-methyladenine DNA glycosylase AlkD